MRVSWTAVLIVVVACSLAGCGARRALAAGPERTRAMQVFVADSLTKVMRESRADERPLQGGPARISACRNERESLQVVVAAGVRRRRGVSLRVSDLAREGGPEVIPAGRILVNRVGYVETRRPAYEVDRVGWWPDPLLPNAPMEIEAGCRQPFCCLLYTSPSPRDRTRSRMPSSA